MEPVIKFDDAVKPDVRTRSADLEGSGGRLPAPDTTELIVFPMSFAQQRLWFLDQLEPGKSVYNVPEAMHLAGPLDVDALKRSINEIVRRHEALRTTFGDVEEN